MSHSSIHSMQRMNLPALLDSRGFGRKEMQTGRVGPTWSLLERRHLRLLPAPLSQNPHRQQAQPLCVQVKSEKCRASPWGSCHDLVPGDVNHPGSFRTTDANPTPDRAASE